MERLVWLLITGFLAGLVLALLSKPEQQFNMVAACLLAAIITECLIRIGERLWQK